MKDTLFDVGEGRKKPSVARAEPAAGRQFEPVYKRDFAVVMPIGKIDDTYDCIDEACGAACHDIISEEGGQWYIECAFCGAGQWVRAVRSKAAPKEAEFVFRDGRCAGKTIAQAAADPFGLDYLRWAAQSHPRPTVREACGKHLDRMSNGL